MWITFTRERVSTSKDGRCRLSQTRTGSLNIDVRHSDGTDVVDTGECPGAGEDEGAIGFRLTTDGITEMYRDE